MVLDPSTVPAGAVKFEVANTGKYPHALAIDGVSERTAELAAGQKATLSVKLRPGTYSLYCPIDDHRGLGVQAKLTVK